MFPPVKLIVNVLDKIRRNRVNITIVIGSWQPAKLLFANICRMMIYCRRLSIKKRLVVNLVTGTSLLMLSSLKLTALLVMRVERPEATEEDVVSAMDYYCLRDL